ncbi:MAG: hypothetical protein NPIRA05_12030 [Nitrospirales bacterium]|nr:MAG: hypothetical protein NPIRA05_12030 [Nitrospirales bacterium]
MVNLTENFNSTLRIVLLVAGMLLPWSAAAGGLAYGEERIDASLLVEDMLVLPGTPTPLKAFLFRDDSEGKRIGLSGEKIDFFVQKRLLGQAVTGEDGYASLEYTPRLRGNLTVKAQVRESPRVSMQEATGLLAVWERRRPILLVDLGALLPPDAQGALEKSFIQSPLRNDLLPEPEMGATFELEKLGEFYYNLVYVYRANIESNEVVRSWLRKHRFPAGIPMVVQPGPKAFITFLEKLNEDGWENVSAGIGRTVEFAEVLVERRIQTVIIQEADSEKTFPRRANIVTGWKKVRRYL